MISRAHGDRTRSELIAVLYLLLTASFQTTNHSPCISYTNRTRLRPGYYLSLHPLSICIQYNPHPPQRPSAGRQLLLRLPSL